MNAVREIDPGMAAEMAALKRDDSAGGVADAVVGLIRLMVDNPGQVSVNPVIGRQTITLEVSCASEDVKRLIGRGGRNADALRQILEAISGSQRERYRLEILEPNV